MTRCFRPTLVPTLATLIGLAILLSLGTWQTSRTFEKRESERLQRERGQSEPLRLRSLAQIEAQAESLNYRRVVLSGALDPTRSFLVKHRHHKGRPGDWLVTPLKLADGSGSVLVNRGWLPRQVREQIASERAADALDGDFEGVFYVLPHTISDPSPRPLQESSVVTEWHSLDVASMHDRLEGAHLSRPALLVLDRLEPGAEGVREVEPDFPLPSVDHITKPHMTSERHMGYAAFWYTTALALVCLYLAAAFGLIGSKRRRRDQSLSEPGSLSP